MMTSSIPVTSRKRRMTTKSLTAHRGRQATWADPVTGLVRRLGDRLTSALFRRIIRPCRQTQAVTCSLFRKGSTYRSRICKRFSKGSQTKHFRSVASYRTRASSTTQIVRNNRGISVDCLTLFNCFSMAYINFN